MVHYDPTLYAIMAGDASPNGIGAVLSHLVPNGVEQSIAFTSRMSTSESNYAQLEKEALASIFWSNEVSYIISWSSIYTGD